MQSLRIKNRGLALIIGRYKNAARPEVVDSIDPYQHPVCCWRHYIRKMELTPYNMRSGLLIIRLALIVAISAVALSISEITVRPAQAAQQADDKIKIRYCGTIKYRYAESSTRKG